MDLSFQVVSILELRQHLHEPYNRKQLFLVHVYEFGKQMDRFFYFRLFRRQIPYVPFSLEEQLHQFPTATSRLTF